MNQGKHNISSFSINSPTTPTRTYSTFSYHLNQHSLTFKPKVDYCTQRSVHIWDWISCSTPSKLGVSIVILSCQHFSGPQGCTRMPLIHYRSGGNMIQWPKDYGTGLLFCCLCSANTFCESSGNFACGMGCGFFPTS